MPQQTEADVREEARAALLAAWRVLRPFVSQMDGNGKKLFLRIGHLYKTIESASLKEVNELLVLVRERLGAYGIQVIGEQVFAQVDKAIGATGIATLFEDAAKEQKTP